MPDALKQALAALSKLRSGDRQAILKRLSREQRRALAQLASPPATMAWPVQATLPKPALPSCSPWLAKRLAMLESGEATATSATREAVRALSMRGAP